MSIKAIDDMPIFNARHALTIHVRPGDISRADKKHPDACAVARACRRELHCADVRVHLGRVYVRQNKGSWQRYLTPRSLRTEIIAFDRGGTFMPGEYVLSAPQPSKQKVGKRQGSNKPHPPSDRSHPKRRPPTIVKDVRTGPA